MRLWLGIQIILLGISVFFMVFGVDLLTASYRLKDPFSFIMTFFAASLIILISIALAAGFVIKIIRVYKRMQP